MKNTLQRKCLVVGIILIFVGTNIVLGISGKSVIKSESEKSEKSTDWWPMFHHDLNHSGYSTSTAPETNAILWQYPTYYYIDDASPTVVNEKVFFGSGSKVYCLNANTGAWIWEYTTNYNVTSSPAVANGKVYIGSQDHKIYCLNADTGAWIWEYTTGHSIYSSPAVANGKVYIGSVDNKIYCLNADTGAWIWQYTTGSWIISSPAVADGKVYIGSDDHKIYCLNADTGTWIWEYTTGNLVASPPAVSNGKVFVGSTDSKVYCLNANTGAWIWEYTTGAFVVSSPAVADGKVYIGSEDNKVYCLNANTGAWIWEYTTGSWVVSSPAVADGKLYVGSKDYKVYCLDADTGAWIWEYTTGHSIYSSPAVADGKVYIGSNDNKMYCFSNGDINNPPNTPNNPSPSNHASGVGINIYLSWIGGDPDPDDTVSYDVYFGKVNPPPKLVNNQSDTTYNPGTMTYNTIYYWKIVAWDNHGATNPGPVWDFTTWNGENQPFYFIHMTDPHVVAGNDDVWEEDLEKIRTMFPNPPDFVLCTGDLVDEGWNIENYDELIDNLQGDFNNFYIDYVNPDENIPIYFCPGNHDERWFNKFENYHSKIGPDYCKKPRHNCAIFSLNSGKDNHNSSHPNLPEGDGINDYYTNELTDFYDDVVNSNEEIKIVMLHHPYEANNGPYNCDGEFLDGRDLFINICNIYDIDMVFCGHVHKVDADDGRLVIGDNTNQINTRSIAHDGGNYFRKIFVDSKYEKGYSIDSMTQFSSTLSGDIYSVNMQNSMTTLDIYDGIGNHNGPSGRGEIERQIPMSTYSFWELQNDTLGINTTFTQFMLDKNDTENYSIIIKSLFDDSINVTFFTSLIGGNWIQAEYVNVTMYNGSIATVYANKSIFNYSMLIVDPDKTIRVVTPSSITENHPPNINMPIGPTFTGLGDICNYSLMGIDPNDNNVYYWFDWGDGSDGRWLGPYNSNETIVTAHTWNFSGIYEIRVKTKDDYGLENNWSEPFVVHVINESDLKPTLIAGFISNSIEGTNFSSFNARFVLSLRFSPSFDFRIYKNLELIVISDNYLGFMGSRGILGRFNALCYSESLSTMIYPLNNRLKKLS